MIIFKKKIGRKYERCICTTCKFPKCANTNSTDLARDEEIILALSISISLSDTCLDHLC